MKPDYKSQRINFVFFYTIITKMNMTKIINFNPKNLIIRNLFVGFLFLLLGIFPFSQISAQNGFRISTISLPNGGNAMGATSYSICDPDPVNLWYTVNWTTFATGATNPSIDITLPPGMTYVGGSLEVLSATGPTSASMVGSSLLRLPMTDLVAAEAGSFRFRLSMDCGLSDFLNSSGTAQARLVLDAIADEGSNDFTTNPLNNLIGIPVLIHDENYDVEVSATDKIVGESYNRQFHLKQTGVNRAELNELTICFTHEADLTVTNRILILHGTSVAAPLTGGCVVVNSTNFPTLPLPLAESDSITWQETVTIDGCDDLGSTVDYEWGCNGEACEDGNFQMGIELESNNPSASSASMRTIATCIEDGTEIEFTYQISGLAYDIYFRPSTTNASRTYIDESTLMIDVGSGYVAYGAGTKNSPSTTGSCGGTEFTRYTTDPFPGTYDGRVTPVTVRMKYEILTCCPTSDCAVATGSILGASGTLYMDNMCGDRSTRTNNRNGISMNSSTSDLVPPYIADGATATWEYNMNSIPALNQFNNSGQVCLDFTIESPLVYTPGSVEWVDEAGSDPHTPTTAETITSPSGDTRVEVCFDNGDLHGNGSKIRFDASYACTPATCTAPNPNTDMKIGYRFGDGMCTDNCIMPFLCESGVTVLGDGCCGISCDGLINAYTNIQRSCFGLPDSNNDGCEGPDPTIDMSLVSLDKAMQGDELSFETAARVNLSDPLDSFNYIYLEMTFPSAHEIGSAQTLTIYDASGPSYYTCDALNVFNTGNTFLQYYLTTDLLRGCGDIPTDFVFRDGDSLKVNGTFVNLDNPGCLVQQVNIDVDWFADRSASPVGVDHLSCNTPIPSGYSQVGYLLTVTQNGQNANGCVGARFEYRANFCIGGGDIGIQPFPYEIRNFMIPYKSGMKIPDGLVFDRMEISNVRFTLKNNGGVPNDSENVTAIVNEANGYIVLDWADYFMDCNDNHMPNGGYRFDIEAFFEGGCNSQPSQAEWFYEAEMDFCSPAVDNEIVRTDGVHAGTLPVVPPEVLPSAVITQINPIDEIATWNFNIREQNQANAFNVWVAFDSPSGFITPTELRRGGTTINPTSGIYSLGNFNRNQGINYALDVFYNGCERDSIIAYVGWDCDGVPVSRDQVLQGGLPCPVETLVMYMEPQQGGMQIQVITEPPARIPPCSVFEYEVEIKNVTLAEIYEPYFELFVPYTAGIDIIMDTERACYPCVGGVPYNDTIFAPTDVIITPLGIKSIWDLETLIDDFNFSTPEGWESDERIRLKFQAQTNCDFVAGDFLNFKARGHTFCGEELESILQNSSPVTYDIVEPIYTSFITMNTDEPIDGCEVGEEIRISGNIVFDGDTDGADTIILALPSALEFSSASFDPTQISNAIPGINIIGPVGTSPSTFQELRWGIEAGIPQNTLIPYEIVTLMDPTEILCDDENTLYFRTVRSASTVCGTEVCDIKAASGSNIKNLDIIKNSLTVNSFDIDANCGMTSLDIVNLEISNNGLFDATQDIQIDFYYDADDSGDFTLGDVLVGTNNYTDDIPAGGQITVTGGPFTTNPDETCKLIAFVSGCNCETIAATANSFLTENAGADIPEGCSSESQTLGCGEDLRALGFSYNWFGLNGAPLSAISDPTDPNPTFTNANFNSGDLALEYILITTHPGGTCTSVDTVGITLAGVEVETADLLKICNDSTLYMTGPTGFFNYQWSPTTGLVNPIDPLSEVATPVGSVVYTLTYNDTGGCSKIFQQTVKASICTDLELTKEVNLGTGNIGDILTYEIEVVNQGPNGASGIEVTDQLPSQLTFLSSVPAGEYDEVTGLWQIPGFMLPGDSVLLTIYAQINAGGPIFNVAEISDLDQADLDSTPGNDDDAEDDQQGVCTSVPLDLLCRETKTIGIPDEFASYQWFKDGVAISGATADSLDISETGTYSVEVDGGLCPYGNCCPFDVIEEPCAGIGDTVWEDLNGDGVQDVSETGIENVKIVLYDAISGLAIDSVFTDAMGNYFFEELPTGNYFLDFDITTNTSGIDYTATTNNSGGDDTLDSDANPTTGQTAPFAFDASTGDDLTRDAGYVPVADIGNYVWVDSNQDGLQDGFESPVENATVNLYDSNNNLIATTNTDGMGNYLFQDIPYGDYYVEFDLSTTATYMNYGFTSNGSGDGTNDSEAGPNGQTAVFSFDPRTGDDLTHDAGIDGPTDLRIDKVANNVVPAFGEVITFTIQVNNDGPMNAAGIEVTDQLPSGFNYINDNSGGTYDPVTGIWMIGSLAVGDSISLDIAVEVLPGGVYVNDAEISAMNGTDIDSDPTTGSSTDDLNDGLPDDDEDSVTIYPGQTFDLALDKALASGQASAINLGDHVTYTIQVTNEGDIAGSNITVQDNIPVGMQLSSLDMNGWVATSSNTADVFIPGPVAAGTTTSIDIVMQVIYGPSGATIPNTAEIKDVTDPDGNGVTDVDSDPSNPDITEDDIDDAEIVLLNHDPTGAIYCDKTGVLVTGGTISVTGPNGIPNDEVVIISDGSTGVYEYFEVGPPGIYTITYSHPDGITLSPTRLPTGAIYDVTTTAPNDVTFGSDTLNNYLIDEAAASNPYYLVFDVEVGDPYVFNNNLPVQCVFIGSTVCNDTDGNNMDDGTEPGLPGVIVGLYDCADTTTVLSQMITNSLGEFAFDGLLAGDYRLRFTDPNGYQAVSGNILDENGFAPCTTLAFGECDTTTTVCYTLLADIGNFVWQDTDGDGIQDVGEPGIANVKVILYDGLGMAIDSVFTDSNGEYLFEDLPGGDYQIVFAPSGAGIGDSEFTSSNTGTGANDSDADVMGATTVFTFNPYTTGDDLNWDAGIVPVADIGNFVWVDADMDGIQDSGESGLDSVLVILFDSNTGLPLDSVWTDASGAYVFEDVPPGDYYVGFEPNASFGNMNYDFSPEDTGNGTNDSDANSSGFTDSFTFDPLAGDNLNIDAGVSPTANIGNFVWQDTDGNGEQDGGESGIAGVTVILYDANTNLPIDTVVTNGSGAYLFTNVPSGDYYIEMPQLVKRTTLLSMLRPEMI